jgi:hypothetical protein
MSKTPVCFSSAEKCNCDVENSADNVHLARHGRYSWDTPEDEGYEHVQITLTDGTIVQTKVWSANVSSRTRVHAVHMLRRAFELEKSLKQSCENILARVQVPEDTDIFQKLIDSYDEFIGNKYKRNRAVHVTPSFIEEGLRIFVDTNHTMQELDPSSPLFQAVNKPKNVLYTAAAIDQGLDRKLRSSHRHVVFKTLGTEHDVIRLLIHEFAHTPANHLCFRVDDHCHDFRIFQVLFTQMAIRDFFLPENSTKLV